MSSPIYLLYMENLTCCKCAEQKPEKDFYSKSLCKKCNNKSHYEANKEYYRKKSEGRRKDLSLKKSLREYNTKWTRRRRKTHLETRIKGNLRNRLRDAIKGRRKSETTIKLLGCSWECYKSHIESLWVDGMTWENYGRGNGKWNIDHIKPLSLFNLKDPTEQAKAFHYLNTQPLWEVDNFRKGNRI